MIRTITITDDNDNSVTLVNASADLFKAVAQLIETMDVDTDNPLIKSIHIECYGERDGEIAIEYYPNAANT